MFNTIRSYVENVELPEEINPEFIIEQPQEVTVRLEYGAVGAAILALPSEDDVWSANDFEGEAKIALKLGNYKFCVAGFRDRATTANASLTYFIPREQED